MATTTINASFQTNARKSVSNQSSATAGWNAVKSGNSDSHNNFNIGKTVVDPLFYARNLPPIPREGGTFILERSFFHYDLSSIPSTDTITAITWSYNYSSNADEEAGIVVDAKAFGSSGTAYQSSDWDNWRTSTRVYSKNQDFFSNPNDEWFYVPFGFVPNPNEIPFNSNAISDANANGYLNLAVVGYGYDYLNTNNGATNVLVASDMKFGTNNLNNLIITHSAAPTGYSNRVNNVLPTGSNSEVNDVDASTISRVNNV